MAVLILSLSSCSVPTDEVLNSLGNYKSKEYFTSVGFQDYTDYAKYVYEDTDFSNNEYFELISRDSENDFKKHVDNFERWIEAIKESDPKDEVVLGYDFDSSVISDGDYLYIYDDSDYPEFGNYNVYFFDIETKTLYFFHSNI